MWIINYFMSLHTYLQNMSKSMCYDYTNYRNFEWHNQYIMKFLEWVVIQKSYVVTYFFLNFMPLFLLDFLIYMDDIYGQNQPKLLSHSRSSGFIIIKKKNSLSINKKQTVGPKKYFKIRALIGLCLKFCFHRVVCWLICEQNSECTICGSCVVS